MFTLILTGICLLRIATQSKGGKSSPSGKGKGKGESREALLNGAADGGGGPEWSGNAATLNEQRDATVHSSQQKIKVVV